MAASALSPSVPTDGGRIVAAASPEPYRIRLRSGWVPATDARRVDFTEIGFGGWDLFVHHIDGGYRVSERLTGLAVVSALRADGSRVSATETRREDAISRASEFLRAWGPLAFTRSVVSILSRREGNNG